MFLGMNFDANILSGLTVPALIYVAHGSSPHTRR